MPYLVGGVLKLYLPLNIGLFYATLVVYIKVSALYDSSLYFGIDLFTIPLHYYVHSDITYINLDYILHLYTYLLLETTYVSNIQYTKQTHTKQLKSQRLNVRKKFIDSLYALRPVSYTHLDVYKRQVYNCTGNLTLHCVSYMLVLKSKYGFVDLFDLIVCIVNATY